MVTFAGLNKINDLFLWT